GTGRVARAAPDGYTLLVHQMAIAANVSLFPKTSFNVEKDLTAVGLVNYSMPIIVGRKSLAANSLAELVAWMKRPSQRIKFAHAGIGFRTDRLLGLSRTTADDRGGQFLPASGDRALGRGGTHKPHRGGAVTLACQLTAIPPRP